MSANESQLLKGVLTLLLLQLVAEQEDYGYSIVVRLQERGFGDLAEGTVYPALTRLESNKLLASRLVRSAAGPARKYYRLTAAGREELTDGIEAWKALVGAVGQVLPTTQPPRSAPRAATRAARSTP